MCIVLFVEIGSGRKFNQGHLIKLFTQCNIFKTSNPSKIGKPGTHLKIALLYASETEEHKRCHKKS